MWVLASHNLHTPHEIKNMQPTARRASRRRRPAKSRTLHTRIDEMFFLRVEMKAEQEKVNLSDVVRDALENFLVARA